MTCRRAVAGWAGMAGLRAEAGLRTPQVLPAADGRRIVTVTGHGVPPRPGATRFCVRFEFLPGTEPPGSDGGAAAAAPFAELGAITARMHAHASDWERPAWFTRFRWDVDAAFGPQPRWGRWQDVIGVGPAEAEI